MTGPSVPPPPPDVPTEPELPRDPDDEYAIPAGQARAACLEVLGDLARAVGRTEQLMSALARALDATSRVALLACIIALVATTACGGSAEPADFTCHVTDAHQLSCVCGPESFAIGSPDECPARLPPLDPCVTCKDDGLLGCGGDPAATFFSCPKECMTGPVAVPATVACAEVDTYTSVWCCATK